MLGNPFVFSSLSCYSLAGLTPARRTRIGSACRGQIIINIAGRLSQ